MKFLTTLVFMPPTWNDGMLEFWNKSQKRIASVFEATFLSSNGKLTNILQAKTYKAIASCQTLSFLNPRLMFFRSMIGLSHES